MHKFHFFLLLGVAFSAAYAEEDSRPAVMSAAEIEKAIDVATSALSKNPKDAGAYGLRGRLWLMSEKWERAFDDFKKAVELDPDNGQALVGLGCARLGRNAAAGKQAEYRTAVAELSAALHINPGDAEALCYRGFALWRLGDAKAGLVDLSRSLELDHGMSRAYNYRGQLYCDLAEYKKAITDLSAAIRASPNNSDGYRYRGYAKLRSGQPAEAIPDLNEAIRLSPADGWAHGVRGSARFHCGDYTVSIEDYSIAIGANPHDASNYIGRGWAHLRATQYDRAIEDLTTGIKIDPKDPGAFRARAEAYAAGMNNTQKAIDDLTAAISLEPSDPSLLIFRARGLYDLDRYGQARTDYLTAIRLDPTDPEPYEGLAVIEATSNQQEFLDPQAAVRHAKRACEITNWGAAAPLAALAAAYARGGDFREALHWQQQALQLGDVSEREAFKSRTELFKSGKPYTKAKAK